MKNSKSDRDVARAIGYSVDSGSVFQSIHKMYAEMNLDTSHFTGQGWNKNNYAYERFRPGNYIKRGTLLNPLIHLRGRKCENCGLEEWIGKDINLEVHHIDGDHLNNSFDNL